MPALVYIIEIVFNFAGSKILTNYNFRDFCLLSKTDQRQLIARNSPLYIQMYMGCFFGAADGVQQKDLIKQYQIITKNKTSINDKYINIHQFNSITR